MPVGFFRGIFGGTSLQKIPNVLGLGIESGKIWMKRMASKQIENIEGIIKIIFTTMFFKEFVLDRENKIARG